MKKNLVVGIFSIGLLGLTGCDFDDLMPFDFFDFDFEFDHPLEDHFDFEDRYDIF